MEHVACCRAVHHKRVHIRGVRSPPATLVHCVLAPSPPSRTFMAHRESAAPRAAGEEPAPLDVDTIV
eukprot:11769891-Alexandrium_andersonii.AAC.1